MPKKAKYARHRKKNKPILVRIALDPGWIETDQEQTRRNLFQIELELLFLKFCLERIAPDEQQLKLCL